MKSAPACLILFACLSLTLAGCASNSGVNAEQAAEANAALGADFLRKGDNEQALASFQRALNYDSRNTKANWGMAVVNDRFGEPANARRYYEKAIGLNPSGAIFNSYAAFLCQQGEVDPAIKYFDRAANNPRYAGAAGARANAGLCLQRAGRERAAETYYRQALSADPDQPTALAGMARLMYAQGEYLRARAFLERADAASRLDPEELLLGARIELALGDRGAAAAYVERHNAREPSATLSLRQLEQSR